MRVQEAKASASSLSSPSSGEEPGPGPRGCRPRSQPGAPLGLGLGPLLGSLLPPGGGRLGEVRPLFAEDDGGSIALKPHVASWILLCMDQRCMS